MKCKKTFRREAESSILVSKTDFTTNKSISRPELIFVAPVIIQIIHKDIFYIKDTIFKTET